MSITGRREKYTGKTPEINHRELVDRAFLYLKFSCNCKVAFKERVASTSESPDVVGFCRGFSYLIECKTSRADFLADKKKHFRRRPEDGMGYERYFMAPVGLLEPSEMPEGWGLLEVYEKPPRFKNYVVKIAHHAEPFIERNLQAEVSYLVSAIRRIDISMVVFIEDNKGEQNG